MSLNSTALYLMSGTVGCWMILRMREVVSAETDAVLKALTGKVSQEEQERVSSTHGSKMMRTTSGQRDPWGSIDLDILKLVLIDV